MGKLEYRSTISGVLYMGVVFLVIWRKQIFQGKLDISIIIIIIILFYTETLQLSKISTEG